MAGNWKMNLNHVEAAGVVQKLAWSLEDAKYEAEQAEAAVIVPFTDIRTVQTLEERLAHISTPLSLSVLGCVVNGPGEARETDIGLTGGGAGKHMVYISGVTDHTVQDADMLEHIVRLVEQKAAEIEADCTDAMGRAAE